MQKYCVLFLLLFLFGRNELLSQVVLSGFFDVEYKQPLNQETINNFEFGQFEIGLERSVSPKLNFEGAIAFNSETNNFELGSAFVEYNISSSLTQSFLKNVFESFAIVAGQFDVPFGIDYKCIASPDRKMVSTPIAIQNSIACLSSLGIELHGESESYNFNSYLINGIDNEIAGGFRVGILFYSDLEVGTSYLSYLQKNNPNILGGDIKFVSYNHKIKAEVISSKGLFQGEIDSMITSTRNSGFYIQYSNTFLGPLDKLYSAGLRYGNWGDNVNPSIESRDRISFLLGVNFLDNAEFRTEFNLNNYKSNKTENLIYMKLVFTF